MLRPCAQKTETTQFMDRPWHARWTTPKKTGENKRLKIYPPTAEVDDCKTGIFENQDPRKGASLACATLDAEGVQRRRLQTRGKYLVCVGTDHVTRGGRRPRQGISRGRPHPRCLCHNPRKGLRAPLPPGTSTLSCTLNTTN